MVLKSDNFRISFTINGGQTLENSLTVTSMNTTAINLTGDYTTTILNMYAYIDSYKQGLLTTDEFLNLQMDAIVVLEGLENGLYFLNDFGNKTLNLITVQTTDTMITILSTFDVLFPYSGNVDPTYYFWIEIGSFKDYIVSLTSSEESILKIFPSISSQNITGGVATTRVPIQSIGTVSEQVQTLKDQLAVLFNNDTNLSAAVAAMEGVVTGIYPTTENSSQIEFLQAEIANLEIEKVTATPEQIILINEQIALLNQQIKNLQNSGTKKELPSAEVARIKELVRTYTSVGSDAMISLTGSVLQTDGYPVVPIGSTTTVVTPTGTKSEQIQQLRVSIALIEANQIELNQRYEAAVAAGTVTPLLTQEYRTQTALNTAQIADLQAQIKNLQTKNTIFTTNWWNWGFNWSSTSTIWSWPANTFGRYNGTSSTSRKKNLHQTLRLLPTLIEPVNTALPSFQGVISTISVIATPEGDDAITLNYSFFLNDQGWSVVIQKFPIYQLVQYLASYTRQVSLLPNTQKVNLCKMFGVSTTSIPTEREMTIVFLVSMYTYICCSLFVIKNLEQIGDFIAENVKINAIRLLNPTALITMSNSAIPFFSQNSFEDTKIAMSFGILKALTPLILGGDTLTTINSSNGLTVANVATIFFGKTSA